MDNSDKKEEKPETDGSNGIKENACPPQDGENSGAVENVPQSGTEKPENAYPPQDGENNGFCENVSQNGTNETQNQGPNFEDNTYGKTGVDSGGQNETQQPQGRQYQDPQNPYGYYYGQNNPYGQSQQQQYGQDNPYGQSQQQYGQNNPYGQSGPYSPGGPYVPYGQYWQNNNNGPYMPYGMENKGRQNYYGHNGKLKEHQKKSRGLKIFLWVLTILAAGLVGGLAVYSVGNVPKTRTYTPNSSSSGYGGSTSSAAGSSLSGTVIGGVNGNGLTPNFPGISIKSIPSGSQMDATETYKKVIQSVTSVQVTIVGNSSEETATSEGTGIIASSSGYILTNAHVVNYSKGNAVKVTLHNGKVYAAVVAGYDKTSDIAVLKINASNLSSAVFGNADDMQIGNQVIAIGNPGGISFAGSLTGGYISALNRAIETNSDNGMTYIQTDAAINPGNSGGPLVNMYGQVIGINSSKVVAKGYESMGFSIPISRARTIINDLITDGYVIGRCRLGITAGSVPEMYREYYNYPEGVLIQSLSSDSDLKKKGVVVGDIITKAGGQDIKSIDDIYTMLNEHKPGDEISLTVYSTLSTNSGKTKTVKVKLLEDKGETQNK